MNGPRQFSAGAADEVCGFVRGDPRYDYRVRPEGGFDDVCGILRRSLSEPSGLMQCSKHQEGPLPWSLSCTCLSSARLTNSTESMADPSWVRNRSIASFIGGGRSPHQLIA